MNRREDLPEPAKRREAGLRMAIRAVEIVLPNTAIVLLASCFDDAPASEHFVSYISNCERKSVIKMLREQADRLEMGTADTLGRGEA